MTASDTRPPSSSRMEPSLDRSAGERGTPDLLQTLRHDPDTRVLVVRGDAAPLAGGGLMLVEPTAVPDDGEWAFLGRDEEGAGVLLAAFGADRADPLPAPDGWAALRTVGALLPAGEASALVTAIALGRWLLDASFCPACGAAAELHNAGWSRRCPQCGREHFPRTDPAVIVAVTSADEPERLLLGSNAMWDANRFSCFAGFAEAGESLEEAVVREVREEAGVHVTALRYRGSQGWPYPRSLMLGFRAVATRDADAEADGEEILDVRWFTRDEVGSALTGDGPFTLPGPTSIAHRLIREWLEGTA